MLNITNLVTTKCLTFLQKKSALESSQQFSKHMKSAASKQNNMAIICQEHQTKGKPYIFTHDSKLKKIYLTFEMKNWPYITVQYKKAFE